MSVFRAGLAADTTGQIPGTSAPLRFARRWAPRLLPFLFPLAVLLLWQWSTRELWIPPQLLPSPRAVAHALWQTLVSGELTANIATTVLLLFEGFALAFLLGVGLGFLTGLSRIAEDYLYPTFKVMAYVPVLGWLPVWLAVLGVSDALKVVLVAQAALSPIVLNVHDGVRDVPLSLLQVGRVFLFTPLQNLRWIVLPVAFPRIWSGIRFGLTKAWLVLVAVELLASTKGLGYMMVNARNLYQIDIMFVSVIAIATVGLLLDCGLEAVERHVLRWRPRTEFKS